MSRKRGRPKGSTNITTVVEVQPSRCDRCGSSQRTNYENTYRRDYTGAGLEYIEVIYRVCHCLDCGKPRRDQEYVYGPRETNRNTVIEGTIARINAGPPTAAPEN